MTQPVQMTPQQLSRMMRETIKRERRPVTRTLRDASRPQGHTQFCKIGIPQTTIPNATQGPVHFAKGPPTMESAYSPAFQVLAVNITGESVSSGDPVVIAPVALNEVGPTWYILRSGSMGAPITCQNVADVFGVPCQAQHVGNKYVGVFTCTAVDTITWSAVELIDCP